MARTWGFLLTFVTYLYNIKQMSHKKKRNGYWTKEKVREEALKYQRPIDFKTYSAGAYNAALRGKFINEICSHMSLKTYWTTESLQKEASKYKNKTSFRKNNRTAYHIAHQRGIIDEICTHMKPLLKYWDKKSVYNEALKYDNRTNFHIGCPGAYNAATSGGYLKEICSHMIEIRHYWTDEELAAEALKSSTRAEFQQNSESAYITSLNRGLMDKICGHMKVPYGHSLGEKEVFKLIKSFYPSAIENTKKIIPPLELDIYVPEINLAIEYDGLTWHSEKFKKDKNFHINKNRAANKIGVRIIHIFADEWQNKKEQVKNYLISTIGKNSVKIGARKTELKEIRKKEASIFLMKNHIQGCGKMKIAFGLYYEKELLAVMTGIKHPREKQKNVLILNRLAFKSDVLIQGGSSKLLNAFINYAKNNNYSKLISWSDNRWSEGKVYEKLGFILEEEIDPDYSYIKGEKRYSKQSYTKKKLIKMGAKGTMLNTEKELAATLKLYRIWDCGKKRWAINLK
jgi:hypothetical protein